MSKGKKIMIVILLAVIFAAISGYALYVYLTPLKTTIYVYNGDYSAGTTITANMLTPISVDNNIVINGKQARTMIITSITTSTKRKSREVLSLPITGIVSLRHLFRVIRYSMGTICGMVIRCSQSCQDTMTEEFLRASQATT